MKRLVWTIAAAIGLASPAFAYATDAYLTADVDLLSGPDQDYPAIDHLEEGSEVSIQGCTDGWEWCDVVAYDQRGWVPGGYLQAEYQNQWVLVPDYAPTFEIPIVTFSIQNYWDTYYRYRPFYYRRQDWYRWRPPHRQRPYPVDFPPPHPWHQPPPVQHHPQPPRGLPGVPPHAIPMPRNPNPPLRNPNPPPRVVPPNQPLHPMPPPRVAPMPQPVPPASRRNDTPRPPASKDKDPVEQGQRL